MRRALLIRIMALLAALGGEHTSRAQLFDSIAQFRQEKGRLVVRLDMRGSFVRNANVRIAGAKVGWEHAGRFQYGVGYSFLWTPVTRDEVLPDLGLTTLRLRVGYVTPYVDYAFYQRGPWEVRLPVQLGIGGASVVYRDPWGNKQREKRTGLLLYEPAMTVQYRFLKYLGVGAGWGFRLVWQTGPKLGESLSAPIYTFGLRVFFGDLWKDLRSAGNTAPSAPAPVHTFAPHGRVL